jgi:hypothetical protein
VTFGREVCDVVAKERDIGAMGLRVIGNRRVGDLDGAAGPGHDAQKRQARQKATFNLGAGRINSVRR